MAKSEQKRQKQLAKKRAKEQRKRQQMAQQKQQMASLAGQMKSAAQAPVYGCYASSYLGRGNDEVESGIGNVFLARRVSAGRVAVAVFLVDDYCLGVKNVMGRLMSPSEFDEAVEDAHEQSELISVSPSYARKLVEQAIAYADSLGLPPHGDYRKVAPIWGDIDADECDTEFTFGRNGKPCYMAGPMDDHARQQLVYRTLQNSLGEGNFDITLADSDPSDFEEMRPEDEEETAGSDSPTHGFLKG